ncbi:unnamed protein product [Prorocentrum cordatum]|uniref:LisH domain-containing protein ARMC9 n=1 Tax=Prorocentrum cordatum TaxID=2364126 RepID=A0ABN9WLV3_9DINO|nr:unnamed protein product [Polarella glacialis]
MEAAAAAAAAAPLLEAEAAAEEGGTACAPAAAEGSAGAITDAITDAGTPGGARLTPRGCGFGGYLCELAVLEAVEEYLQFHGLERSVRALSAEVERYGLRQTGPRPSREGPAPGETGPPAGGGEFAVAVALAAFEAGRQEDFFAIWRRLVPEESARHPVGCTLQLRLHVHFGSLGTRRSLRAGAAAPGAAAPAEELPNFGALREFLATAPVSALDESAGSALAPLFALPFVPRPHQNPALRFVFEEAWLQRLRSDLGAFLSAAARGRHAPALRHLAGSLVAARGPQAAPPPASWHELVRIADLGLAAALQLCRPRGGGILREARSPASPGRQPGRRSSTPVPRGGAGQSPGLLREVADARRRLAAVGARPQEPPAAPGPQPGAALGAASEDGLAGGPLRDLPWPASRERERAAPSREEFGRASPSQRLHSVQSARGLDSRARAATALLPVPPALDFGRITQVIEGAEQDPQAPPLKAVLRAVLRRLALPDEAIRPRRTFLAALACFGTLRALAGRLGEIAAGSDAELTELSLAVLAVCACEVVGRREIEAGESPAQPSCLGALVMVLGREPVATLVHMQCLAVLQRLSLRRQLQLKMIELGAVDWILQTLPTMRRHAPGGSESGSWHLHGLGGGPSLHDFSVEFMSALLMNLTLRAAGRRRCSELGAYGVLVGLIEHPNEQVRTHVNGTLYALFCASSFRADARRAGAEATLQETLARVQPMSDRDDLLRRQLECLLAQVRRPADASDEDEDTDSLEGIADGGMDDGDNFLDEEELAGQFFLASMSAVEAAAEAAAELGDPDGERTSAAATEAVAREVAAAEEALRHFRAQPQVADSQQRRFHAFVSRSSRSIMSPKRIPSSMQSPSPFGDPYVPPPAHPAAAGASPPGLQSAHPAAAGVSSPGLVPIQSAPVSPSEDVQQEGARRAGAPAAEGGGAESDASAQAECKGLPAEMAAPPPRASDPSTVTTPQPSSEAPHDKARAAGVASPPSQKPVAAAPARGGPSGHAPAARPKAGGPPAPVAPRSSARGPQPPPAPQRGAARAPAGGRGAGGAASSGRGGPAKHNAGAASAPPPRLPPLAAGAPTGPGRGSARNRSRSGSPFRPGSGGAGPGTSARAAAAVSEAVNGGSQLRRGSRGSAVARGGSREPAPSGGGSLPQLSSGSLPRRGS